MNKTKLVFLFLLLAMPVLIYLFLQGFGTNHFAIPIYYLNGAPSLSEACPAKEDPIPYQIDKRWMSEMINGDLHPGITVYEIGNVPSEQLRNNLYTFLEKYKKNSLVRLVSLRQAKDSSITRNRYSSWFGYNLADSSLLRAGRCILRLNLNQQLKADSGLVLVDQKQQIRGYYDPLKLKEIDRLNTELYILLSE